MLLYLLKFFALVICFAQANISFALVYQCENNGKISLQDLPCSPDEQETKLPIITKFNVTKKQQKEKIKLNNKRGKSTKQRAKKLKKKLRDKEKRLIKARRKKAKQQVSKEKHCQLARSNLKKIATKYRSGYTLQQEHKLVARIKKYSEQKDKYCDYSSNL